MVEWLRRELFESEVGVSGLVFVVGWVMECMRPVRGVYGVCK